jgi:hypothetical protein
MGCTGRPGKQENSMRNFEVTSNGFLFGIYAAADEQGARDACAADAGYKSEAQMAATLDCQSNLVAAETTRPTFERSEFLAGRV